MRAISPTDIEDELEMLHEAMLGLKGWSRCDEDHPIGRDPSRAAQQKSTLATATAIA